MNEESNEASKKVMDMFHKESGQKVSSNKSHFYLSPNVKAEMKIKVCKELGIQATSTIEKYLGFPLRHKVETKNQFNFINEKFICKTL